MGGMPRAVSLTPALLAKAFPFHFAFDKENTLLQTGPVLRRLCPELVEGSRLGDHIRLHQPRIDRCAAGRGGS